MQKGVCSKIKQIRQERGFSQDYMAVQLKITQSHYAKLEKGKLNLTLARLIIISQVLNFKLHQIFKELNL